MKKCCEKLYRNTTLENRQVPENFTLVHILRNSVYAITKDEYYDQRIEEGWEETTLMASKHQGMELDAAILFRRAENITKHRRSRHLVSRYSFECSYNLIRTNLVFVI